MSDSVSFSDKHLQMVEIRYTLINCLNRRFRSRGLELPAGFFKEHFKDLLSLPSGTHIATLEGHTDAVNCLIVVGDKVYSGGDDDTIRVWDVDTHEHIATLRGHADYVRYVIYWTMRE